MKILCRAAGREIDGIAAHPMHQGNAKRTLFQSLEYDARRAFILKYIYRYAMLLWKLAVGLQLRN